MVPPAAGGGYPGVGPGQPENKFARAFSVVGGRLNRVGEALNNATSRVAEIGDEIERRHFDGDFLGAIDRTVDTVGENATRLADRAGATLADAAERLSVDVLRTPGLYRVLPANGMAVTTGMSKDDPLAGGLRQGTVVNVLEVLNIEREGRIRGRIDSPAAGWISLSNTETGERWAERLDPGSAVPERHPEPTDAVPRSSVRSNGSTVVQSPAPAVPSNGGAVPSSAAPATDSAASLCDEAQKLQEELEQCREMRRGRAAALTAMDEGLRQMRAEIAEESRLGRDAHAERVAADARRDDTERLLEELQERHHALLGRKATQEAELRRLVIEAEGEKRAAREARQGPQCWARDGPEVEALKEAKISLAETSMALDEARLRSRTELVALQKQLDELFARSRMNGDDYVAPESFKASIWKLMSVAAGREDG